MVLHYPQNFLLQKSVFHQDSRLARQTTWKNKNWTACNVTNRRGVCSLIGIGKWQLELDGQSQIWEMWCDIGIIRSIGQSVSPSLPLSSNKKHRYLLDRFFWKSKRRGLDKSHTKVFGERESIFRGYKLTTVTWKGNRNWKSFLFLKKK